MKPYDLACDPSPWLQGQGHEIDKVLLNKKTAVREVIALSQKGYDVFINLCDGAWDEDRPGIEVVQTLERLGQAYTGATPGFYEPSREAMKRVCHYWGIGTPGHVFAENDEEIERAAATLRFPLIPKHPSSYSSIGLSTASRVETLEDLRREAWKMIDAFGQALIEEFIDGREFTVLVAEHPDERQPPTAYVPIEYRFPDGATGFKHFERKWVTYHDMYGVVCDEPELCERLKDASRKLFTGLGGASYGRCDIRVDAAGNIFMLEINPNCGIFYPVDEGSADVILNNDPAGHEGFLEQIIAAALRRQAQRRRAWEVRRLAGGSYGLVAARPIAEGEMIEAYEEQPHVLVTRSHVERHWDPLRRSWFEQYAYPLTDEVWVMWDPNPDDWRPLNHACDPNAWLEGLDLVARRPIARGEQITVDYATFLNEVMPPFDCACGGPACRGTIRGTDHLEPFVARYGDHVSDYVRTKRALRS